MEIVGIAILKHFFRIFKNSKSLAYALDRTSTST